MANPKPPQDIVPKVNPKNADVEKWYDHTIQYLDEVTAWYIYRKNRRKTSAYIVYIAVVTLGAIGAIIPIMSATVTWVDPRIGYAFIIAAGALRLTDKKFEFSTGWRRYLPIAMKIAALKDELSMNWTQLNMNGTSEKAKMCMLKQYNRELWKLMQEETEEWKSIDPHDWTEPPLSS